MDLDRATWSNIEELNASFLNDSILPWLTCIRQACDQALIFPSDREKGMYTEHNLNAMLRAKIADRFSAYQKAIMYGWMCVNEVRTMENMSSIPGGDTYYIPANLGILGKDNNAE